MRLAVKLLSLAALGLCGCGRGGGASPAKTPAAGPVKAPAATVPAPRWDVSQPPALPAEAVVRKPAVAGQFYPGEAEALRKDVTARLADAGKPIIISGKLRAIIVPHAGYVYSGNTAARAYNAVRDRGFDRAVLLGISHSYPVRKVSVSGVQAYATPLGNVAVDADFAAKLGEAAGARYVPDAEEREHSLEVQLPFLQTVIGPGVRIVPVVVGPDPAAQEKLAGALAGLLDERTLVVISTDLAHYPTLDVAEKSDAAAVESWKTLDVKKVEAVEQEWLRAGHPNLACTLCGSDPVKVLIRLAPLIGVDAVTVLKTDTSATASGDKTRVVGYAAVAFSATGKTPPAVAAAKPGDDLAKPKALSAVDGPPVISAESRKKLLEIARGAATSAAAGKEPARLDLQSLPADLRQPGGAFVTLKNKGELRGCIGRYPGEASIAEVVRAMGMESARDSRFYDAPVTAGEMKAIDIEISVLSPLVKIDDWKKIKLGVHGVVLRRGGRSGVFLPQVATETGWGLEEFLGHLARDKAGLPAGAYKDSDTEIRVFTALIFGEKEN